MIKVTKFLMFGNNTEMLKRMEAVLDSMQDIVEDLRGTVVCSGKGSEIINRIESAELDFAIAESIFFANSVEEEDQWIKDNNIQTKKKET